MSRELREALDRVARRVRERLLWGALALCWAAWAAIGLVLLLSGVVLTPARAIWFAALAAVSGLAGALLAYRSARDPRAVARRVEVKHPDLDAGLLTAVEQIAGAEPPRRGFLREAVLSRALEHHRSHDWREVVPVRTLRLARVAHAASLIALVAVAGALALRSRSEARRLAAAGALDIRVTPGDTEVERGSPLLVVARFEGGAPPEARLVLGGAPEGFGPVAMTRSLEDPTFAGRVESVGADLTYRVEYNGASSPTYRVRVFETPELLKADAKLVFPSYTALEVKTAEDVRHVTAVEGTDLTLRLRLNKEVADAKLVDEKGGEVALSPKSGDPTSYNARLTLADSHRYKVRLIDRDGRRNKLTSEIGVNVTRNRPPTVALSLPGHDSRVSPVEELRLMGQVEDDFGVVRHGIHVMPAEGTPRDVVLGEGAPSATKKAEFRHMIDFEGLKAEPDQLVTYFAWAEDIGPDGKPRRTDGDMFFAEVRHFEEIFRQGEAPSGSAAEEQQGGGGNGQEAEKLAELQKQIINGTWKVIRRGASSKQDAQLAPDARLLAESQANAAGQAKALDERLRDPSSKSSLEAALRAMAEAGKRLGEAASGNTAEPLRPALAAEQAAYQALLKLRAREFEVVRNNSRRGGGGGGGSSPSQRQLNQLELTNREDRFEEQSRARKEQLSKQEKERSETRQVVNRLRELSRRQADLDDRLKELQSALEAAEDEPAKREIERQLKRLRDQQKEILRDTDELQERMESEENRERMADARERVEQGREHVRRASEALEKGQVSQALTEGTRAGRQLDEVRDDLRKQSSGQFADDLAEMRTEARNLDEAQRKLSEGLEARKDQPRKALRDTGERRDEKQALQGQREKLEGLLDRMRRTVGEAEETEPLLAKNLFDTVRKADEQSIPDALRQAERLADAGIPGEAAKASRHAGRGIEGLREGVERAARSVLGDETAALRRARDEVKELGDQLDREIAQADGEEKERDREPLEDGEGNPSDREGGQGEPKDADRADPSEPSRKGGQRRAPGEQQKGESGGRGQQGQSPGGEGDREPREGQPKGEGQQDEPGQAEGEGGGQGAEGQPKGQQGGRGGQGRGSLRDAAPKADRGRDQPGGRRGGGGNPSGIDRLMEGLGGAPAGPGGPITGGGYRQWSDRMREVEELLDDPELRAEAARIRDRVRGAREEFRRHAKVPDWTQLQDMVADPIRELRERISEEVRRRESPDALVPIDRDPVPPRFAEGVRRYYERLGSGR